VLKVAEKTPVGADLGAQSLGGKTVAEIATDLTARIGEKIAVRRFDRVEIPAGKHGLCYAYVHLGGKIGVILSVETESAGAASHTEVETFAENTALQICSMNPAALRRSELSEEYLAKQREIFEAQMRDDPKPKPPAAWPKIIEGKLAKHLS